MIFVDTGASLARAFAFDRHFAAAGFTDWP